MAIRVRTCRDLTEYRTALGSIGHYFGWVPTEEDVERFAKALPVERMHAAFDGAKIVGGSGSFPLELTVPGNTVPCAGVTVVGVLPTHRRRGLLTRMLDVEHAEIRERGEPIAALWASDERIYGRFGYGLASLSLAMELPRASAELRSGLTAPSGRVRLVDQEVALRVLPRVYDRVRRQTAGFLVRSPSWWDLRTLSEEEYRRRGAGPLNRAVLERDGRPAAYALYRVKRDLAGDFRGTVRVVEAVGVDEEATREMWSFLFAVDLMDEISASLLPLDHPLVLQAARMTELNLKLRDGLWVRLLDVRAALSARGYAADRRATLEVTSDPQFGDNVDVWTIEDGVARRSRRRPDVRLDVQALGAAYLGGFSYAELARAGLVEEASRGGLGRADSLFRVDRKPWCPEMF
jgi:predicted acetyltransferase